MNKPERTPKPEYLVTKSNKLIEASYRLSVSEQRVMAMLVCQLSPADEDFKPYRMKVSELAELIDGKTKNLHERVKAVTKGLVGKVLQIREPDGLLHVAWLSAAKYYDGEGLVELSFDPKLKPYLLQLKERFTSYKLANVIQLKSRYSVRLYELLKQYEELRRRTFELPELRGVLGLQYEHATWKDFKRNVLDPAQRELPEKTDIKFSYKTRKKGRKIWYLDFTIRPGKKAGQPTNTELWRLKGVASKCWNDHNGTCGGLWENHLSAKDTCHWCRKFEKKRTEAAGQLQLIG